MPAAFLASRVLADFLVSQGFLGSVALAVLVAFQVSVDFLEPAAFLDTQAPAVIQASAAFLVTVGLVASQATQAHRQHQSFLRASRPLHQTTRSLMAITV